MRPSAATLGLALALAAPEARAYTQWAAAVTLGGGGRLLPDAQREGLVTAGLRADVLFGPRHVQSFRAGPFVTAWTTDFESLVAAAGASVLLPVSSRTPFVVSLGGAVELYNAAGTTGAPLGVYGRVWWGSRSVNLHAHYGMAVGLWLETRWMPASGVVDVVAGLDGDLAFLSLPAVLVYNWLFR